MRRASAVFACVLVALALACGGGPAGKPAPSRPLKPRPEWEAALKGKTRDEVLKLLGPPDTTSAIGGKDVWRYRQVTYDPANGRTDFSMSVWFGDREAVVRLTFSP